MITNMVLLALMAALAVFSLLAAWKGEKRHRAAIEGEPK